MRYLARNLRSIHRLLDTYNQISFENKNYKYWVVTNKVFKQQKEMYDKRTHRVDDGIVSINQPHVRPIVRGKSQAKVEFGSKIHVSMIDGISLLDEIRFGHYPKEVLADQIYCARANRKTLKIIGVKQLSKPLGRLPVVSNLVRPGERNPIEG